MKLFLLLGLFFSQSAFAIKAIDIQKCAAGNQFISTEMMTLLHSRELVRFEAKNAYKITLPKASSFAALPAKPFASAKGLCFSTLTGSAQKIESLDIDAQKECRANLASYEKLEGSALEDVYDDVLDNYAVSLKVIRILQEKGKKEDGHTTGVSKDDVLELSAAFKKGCSDVGSLRPSTAKKLAANMKMVEAMLADVKYAPVPEDSSQTGKAK
jgi:hypothetical protein